MHYFSASVARPLLRRLRPNAARSLPLSRNRAVSTLAGTTDGAQNNNGSSKGSRTAPTEYFNFATRDEFLRRHGLYNSRGRRLRSRNGGIAEEEQQALNSLLIGDSADPQNDTWAFRKDIAVYNGAPNRAIASISVSVDVTAKRFLDMFCDYESRRCKLCNETFVQWHLHAGGIPHSGREGVLLELVRPFSGAPEETIRRWNERLYKSTSFGRIPALSLVNNQVRKRKLKYLLRYLKDREVLVDVFKVSGSANDAARSFEFERLEFIGDGVVKYVLNNILQEVFPLTEGGIRGRLSNFQFVMDGNEGLARGYDFLELQDLTQSARVVSKFKSDVVETLFGELQFYLWSSQLDVNSEPLTFPFTKEMYTLRALVQHVIYETATVLFIYHAEFVLGMLQRIAREEQLQFVRTDPSLLPMSARGTSETAYRSLHSAAMADDDDGYSGEGERYGGGPLTIPAPTTKLMKTQTARAHLQGGVLASFLESTNYDNYKRVVPIGGLLPRSFAPEQLSVIPNYMPHIQRDESLTEQMRAAGDDWRTQLDDGLAAEAKEKSSSSPTSDAASTATHTAEAVVCQLSPTPTAKKTAPSQEALSVPRLKDEELIAELI